MSQPSPVQPIDFKAEFDLAFSAEVREELAHILVQESREAKTAASQKYSRDQAAEVQPRLRRAGIESRLLGLAARFPNLQTKSMSSGGSSYAVRIQSGNVAILCVRASKADAAIRWSSFRENELTQSAQYSLALEPLKPVTVNKSVLAILLYGGPSSAAVPAFALIRFPTSDYKTFVDFRVDLKADFPAAFAEIALVDREIELTTIPIEEISVEHELEIIEIPIEEITEENSLALRPNNSVADTGNS